MEKKKQTILEWYRKQNRLMDAPCGGNGTCGKCKVRFIEEAPAPTEKEKKLLSSLEITQKVRLACMCEMKKEDSFIPVGELLEKNGLEVSYETKEKSVSEIGNYGVAIDIGTTTLVMSLINLTDGQTIATLTELNPQRMYGSDVITRIRFANDGRGTELQKMVKEALEQMFEHLIKSSDIEYWQIKKVAIVGNTTMLHLLQGFSCEGLGSAPFSPVSLSMQKWKTKDAEIFILPGISTFVGADIVAGIYACNMDIQDEVGMLVDVGTNGEMVVGNRQGFFVTSTAAGPVFEGGMISCGMPASKGAITHLTYSEPEWQYRCLGNGIPQGICGSGLIAMLAELYENHIIDENGTLADEYFEKGYTLLHHPEITIMQSDIRELQMGKAAIRAGMELLKMRSEPENIYLAGAFGKGLSVVSAVKVGMFSQKDLSCITAVGNTALEGAKKFLLQTDGEARISAIVAKANEIVLANEPAFEELYICNMQLGDFHY